MDSEERKELESAVESILFASGEPVHIERFCVALSIARSEAEEILRTLRDYYAFERRGIRLLQLEDSWQLCSSPDNGEAVRKAFEIRKPAKLSQPALEALTIVAYYQPTTRAYVDKLRGVDSAYTMNLLVERGLIETCGHLQVPGRPLLYRTTEQFLRAFHLSSLEELPPLPESGAAPSPPPERPGSAEGKSADKSGVLPDQLSLPGNLPPIPRYPSREADKVESVEPVQAAEEQPAQTAESAESIQAAEETEDLPEAWETAQEILWNAPESRRKAGKPRRVRRQEWKQIRRRKPGRRAKRARFRARRQGQKHGRHTDRHAPPEQPDAAENGTGDKSAATPQAHGGINPQAETGGEIPSPAHGLETHKRRGIKRTGRWMRCFLLGCWLPWPWWQCFC